MSVANLAISDDSFLSTAANSSGDVNEGSDPCDRNRSLSSLLVCAYFKASERRCTAPFGVPLRMSRPSQKVNVKLYPASENVGTFGNGAIRLGDVTARGLN